MVSETDILHWDQDDVANLRETAMKSTILHDLDESDDVRGRDVHIALKDIAKGANYLAHMMEDANEDQLIYIIEEFTS